MALFDTLDKEAVFQTVVEECRLSFDDDGVLETAEKVILSRTLRNEETYPVDDMEFWRELLAYPYIFDEL